MALSFEQIEPHFHKWARHFCNRRFEHWELINSAWLYGKARFLPQSKIKFASRRVKYDMIDYMRSISMHRRKQVRFSKGKSFPSMYNFSDITLMSPIQDGEPFETTLIAKNNVDIGSNDFVRFITNYPLLSRLEKLVIKLYYIEGFTQKEVAKVCGLHETRISQVRTNLIERLKAVDYSKAI